MKKWLIYQSFEIFGNRADEIGNTWAAALSIRDELINSIVNDFFPIKNEDAQVPIHFLSMNAGNSVEVDWVRKLDEKCVRADCEEHNYDCEINACYHDARIPILELRALIEDYVVKIEEFEDEENN